MGGRAQSPAISIGMIVRPKPLPAAPVSEPSPPESGTFPRRREPVGGFRAAAADVDSARAVLSRLYGEVHLEPLRDEPFGYEVSVTRFGFATCVEALWPGGGRVEVPSIEDQYVFLAASPQVVEVTLGHDQRAVTTGRHALVVSAGSGCAFRVPPGLRARNLAIGSAALEDHWLHLIGTRSRGHFRFEPVIELQGGEGASVLTLVQLLQSEMTRPQASPLLLASLRDAVCTSLLTELRHGGSPLLHATRAAAPGCVRRAEEYIRERAAEPVTLADLVAAAGVPARALQLAFRKARGTTPMDCLRARRFEIARARLLRADPDTTVAGVAAALGFGTSPGRFSIHYRERFGESPSETLAKGRR